MDDKKPMNFMAGRFLGQIVNPDSSKNTFFSAISY
jgi:hypothetical protein